MTYLRCHRTPPECERTAVSGAERTPLGPAAAISRTEKVLDRGDPSTAPFSTLTLTESLGALHAVGQKYPAASPIAPAAPTALAGTRETLARLTVSGYPRVLRD